MDSLTLFVKLLDAFVVLAKGIGVAMLIATLALFIRLLPRRIQTAAKIFATTAIFLLLLKGAHLSMFVVAAIKLGVWAVGAIFITQAVRLATVLKRRRKFALRGSADVRKGYSFRALRNFKTTYFSSYLRQSPVLLN